MLDALPFLATLGIVEAIQRANQIAGNSSNALKAHAFANIPFAIPDDYPIMFLNHCCFQSERMQSFLERFRLVLD